MRLDNTLAGGGAPHDRKAPLVDLRDVVVDYDGRPALEHVTVSLEPGHRVAVVGPNGAGKSTMLKVIAGLVKPSRGTVAVFGEAPGRHLCIAYVEQRSRIDWQFPLCVQEVVAMGRVARLGLIRRAGRKDRDAVADALERVALSDLRRRQIGELSGGQQQRMFIARALAQQAELLLLDEPFAGLDAVARTNLQEILMNLPPQVSVVAATHDLDVAAGMDRVILLNRSVIAVGSPGQVMTAAHLESLYGRHLLRIGGDLYVVPDDCCEHGESDGAVTGS